MSIASAIAALTPSIWYKLDETSGATATNSGTRINDGTYSGTFDQGVSGPELDTYATRLYAGGQIVSGVMDLTTFVDQSIGMWVSTDASGAINTLFPIVNIGDPSNRLTRGPILYELHATIGTPQVGGRFGATGSANIALPQPIRFWHWVVCTYTTGTGGLKLYVDGVLQPAINLTTPGTLVATDPLLIRSDQPAVVAHVCWWGSVLTQTQIQSVSAALSTWPYDLPINTPPPSTGGGGGLTTDQAAQLTAIEGFTNDIPGLVTASNFISDTVNTINGVVGDINTKVDELLSNWAGFTGVTLPSLNDLLNSILGGVTATIQTASGAVGATLGELFSRKTLDLLTLTDISGGGTCERIEYGYVGAFFGIIVRITAYPPTWQPLAPDQGFYVPDFCVVSLRRGVDTFYRWPVHDTNFVQYPFPVFERLGPEGSNLDIPEPETTIIVDWAQGVCGQVFLMRFP